MPATKKQIVTIAGLLIVGAHFFMLACYQLKPGFFSTLYSYPYFQQNWNLFAPPPSASYRLFVKDENGYSADVFEEILGQHQSNRFKGKEAFLTAFSNSIYYFESAARAKGVYNGNASSIAEFGMIERLVKNYLKHNGKSLSGNVKLILLIVPSGNLPARTYYN